MYSTIYIAFEGYSKVIGKVYGGVEIERLSGDFKGERRIITTAQYEQYVHETAQRG